MSGRIGTLKMVVDNNGVKEYADLFPKTYGSNIEGLGNAINALLPSLLPDAMGPTIQAALTANVVRKTASQWTSANTVLLSGQFGLETDTNLIKIGDGSTAWNSLGYLNAPIKVKSTSGSTTTTTQKKLVLETL